MNKTNVTILAFSLLLTMFFILVPILLVCINFNRFIVQILGVIGLVSFVVYSVTAYTIQKRIYEAKGDSKSIIVREDQKIVLKDGTYKTGISINANNIFGKLIYLIMTIAMVVIYSLFIFNA